MIMPCLQLHLSVLVFALLLTSVTPLAVPRAAPIPLLNNTFLGGLDQLNDTLNAESDHDGLLGQLLGAGNKYTITQNAPNPALRKADINAKRAQFLYGPPVAGGPYFPTGDLGLARVAADQAAIQMDLLPELTNAAIDEQKAMADIAQYDGLDTLRDYTKLYPGNWQLTLPDGPVPGALTNYSDDLFFSMERLSTSPYQVRRLNPWKDRLAFQVDAWTAKSITGMTLQQLFKSGRLFYADYRDQAKLVRTTRYAAACDAYFYIDRYSGEFLPLAIRTNAGAGPIYTPMDSRSDWTSAKIMYNCDDFWFAQWNHLANTHEVVQIAYMAAIRTLSEDHPVKAFLDRLMYEVFAIQPLAATILFAPGAGVDQVFAYTGQSAQQYTTNLYKNKGSGRFQGNYFRRNLQNRGLIDTYDGPPLKDFPFYEDAGVIWDAIHAFFTSFLNSYYSSDKAVRADKEIQNWAKEANGPAEVIDFPKWISSKAVLADILTHFAHLASSAHHTVNTNELLSISSTLPFHTASLYHPVPTKKPTGVKPVQYLPPFEKVIESFTVAALFARPLLVDTNRTLLHMFDDPAILRKMNPQTRQAAGRFKRRMQGFSQVVSARTFDSEGLSQGMPFVWQALDPNVQPYSITT